MGPRAGACSFRAGIRIAATLTMEEARAYIVEAVGVDESELDFEVESIRPWNFIAGLSERFSNGRVFSSATPAHAFIPTGGMGSNTGFSGAHNLCWKLAYVLGGHSPTSLLDTYEEEHRRIATRRVRLSLENAALTGAVARAYLTGGDMAEAERNCHQYACYEGMIMGYEYESALCQLDQEPPPYVENEHSDFIPGRARWASGAACLARSSPQGIDARLVRH